MPDPKPYTYQRALNYVLWLLSRQAYTTTQLKERLDKKQASPEVVTAVIEKLEEMHFIDDVRYAEQYISSRQHKKGRLKLRQELFQKGIDEATVNQTLDDLEDTQQVTSATQLLARQLPKLQKTEPRQRYGKAYAFLARRGFGSDVIRQVLVATTFEEFPDYDT